MTHALTQDKLHILIFEAVSSTMGIYNKQIEKKTGLSRNKVAHILGNMKHDEYLYFMSDVGWRTTQKGRDEFNRLQSLGITDVALAKGGFEAAIFNIMGKDPITATEIAVEYYGNTSAMGPVRRALFILIEQGKVKRVGEPRDDTYQIVT